MEYIPVIVAVASIHLLAVMSPGPDFIMTIHNSLKYSRRTGIYSAIGLGLGIGVHVTYCLVGIAVLISKSVLLFSVIKYLGAAYLIYIGIKALMSKKGPDYTEEGHVPEDISRLNAIRSGFLTNVTNPKATLFFLSLFTLVISPGTPLAVKLFMGVEMVVATMLWFSLVAVLVSHKAVRKHVAGIQHRLEQGMGGILILFGLKVATQQVK